MAQIAIHPAVDRGLKPAAKDFAGGTLRCLCATDPVEVKITSQVLHNHVCGCTQCWKPKGAVFSRSRVVPAKGQGDRERRQAEGRQPERAHPPPRLHAAAACTCTGRSRREKHAFDGAGLHSHRAVEGESGWAPPEVRRLRVVDHRGRAPSPTRWRRSARSLEELGLQPYDCLSPALMDDIATSTAKAAGRAARSDLTARVAHAASARAWWRRWSSTKRRDEVVAVVVAGVAPQLAAAGPRRRTPPRTAPGCSCAVEELVGGALVDEQRAGQRAARAPASHAS